MHELNAIDKKKRNNIRERLEVIGSTETGTETGTGSGTGSGSGSGTPCQIGECSTLHSITPWQASHTGIR